MLAKNECEERTRSIRKQLLIYMDFTNSVKVRMAALGKAQAELKILADMENGITPSRVLVDDGTIGTPGARQLRRRGSRP